MESSLAEKKRKVEQFREDLEQKRAVLAAAEAELAQSVQKKEELDTVVTKFIEELQELEARQREQRQEIWARLAKLKEIRDGIEKTQRKISDCMKAVGDSEALESEKTTAEEAIEATRAEMQRCVLVIGNCDLAQQELRHLEDQMRLFMSQDKIEKLQECVQKLGLSEGPTSADLKAREKTVNDRYLSLNNESVRRKAQREDMQLKLRAINLELKKDDILNARTRLRAKVIEKVVMQAAVEDLKKYRKVLDDSIIAFHHKKMEQINQVLRELWPRVYQGNDIETIMIKWVSFWL